MFDFLSQHQFSVAVALYWVVSAAISSMPEPAMEDVPAYSWLYRFLHTIAGVKTAVFVLVVPLVLANAACGAAHYTIHPAALDTADSISYDTLLIAEARSNRPAIIMTTDISRKTHGQGAAINQMEAK